MHAFYVGGGEEGLSRIQWFKSRSPSTGGNDLVEIGPVQTKRVSSHVCFRRSAFESCRWIRLTHLLDWRSAVVQTAVAKSGGNGPVEIGPVQTKRVGSLQSLSTECVRK